MTKLRIGYVPEHFSSPLLQLAARDEAIELVSCPSGTGQMITAFNEHTIDIAIALTESLIAGIAKGNKNYKLVGCYVNTPLNWAVITGKCSNYNSIQDLRGQKLGISRIGSGSQVMASVMALQHGWKDNQDLVEPLSFSILNSFENLRNSVNDGSTAAFMWEHFTTKPYKDSGEVRFIGNVLTPWPSWCLAAAPNLDKQAVQSFLDRLTKYVVAFHSQESRQGPNIDFIKSHFGYEEQDIKDWLQTVGYPESTKELPKSVVMDTLDVLATAGVVVKPVGGFQIGDFVDTDIANIT